MTSPDHAASRLIEPLALLHGAAARAACDAGLALRFAGGGTAFALCRLIDGTGSTVVPVGDVPAAWAPILERVTARAPDAGLPSGPLVMGILNVTPDSFSDGGAHDRPEAAIAAGIRMAEQGASLVDVGGESTRPGAVPVAPDEEQARILPVVKALARAGLTVSVDTRHAATMRAALDAGARLINDVSALGHDPRAPATVAAAGCPAVLMHMRGTPQTMAGLADYDDVAVVVVRELAASLAAAERAGIARRRLLVDPGIGFAKTAEQNLELLRRLPILANLGCRVLLGVSRKGFIGQVAGQGAQRHGLTPPPQLRDPGSIAAALPGLAFADIVLRVHDVPGTLQAVRLWQAIQG